MSVKKCDPSILRSQSKSYTVLVNNSLNMIKNGSALAIWCFIQSKPPTWIIQKAHIIAYFDDMGRDKVNKALNYLRDLGLLKTVVRRDENGKLQGKEIIILDEPDLNNRSTENPYVGDPHRSTEIPNVGKTASSNNIYINNNNNNNDISNTREGENEFSQPTPSQNVHLVNKTKPKDKKACQLPDDFEVTDKIIQYCADRDLPDPEEEFEKFKNYHMAKGSTFKDWTAAFRNWMLKAKEYKQNSTGRGNNEKQYKNYGDQWIAEYCDKYLSDDPTNPFDDRPFIC